MSAARVPAREFRLGLPQIRKRPCGATVSSASTVNEMAEPLHGRDAMGDVSSMEERTQLVDEEIARVKLPSTTALTGPWRRSGMGSCRWPAQQQPSSRRAGRPARGRPQASPASRPLMQARRRASQTRVAPDTPLDDQHVIGAGADLGGPQFGGGKLRADGRGGRTHSISGQRASRWRDPAGIVADGVSRHRS